MADQVGRAALTIGGGYFFGPLGALAGGILGDLLFPVEAGKGPRLSELNVQNSTVGAPIPIIYGTAKLAGNVIWSGGLVESEHEGQSAGKGGPSGPTTYSYSIDVAIGICEGPISGIRRVWADADLIYDSSSDEVLTERLTLEGVSDLAQAIAAVRATSAQVDFTLYLGDEDQLPDPTIESYETAGTVPAYRGLAYIVFPAFELERFGNRIPNFRFEVVQNGTPAECGVYSPGHLEPWLPGTLRDPRNPLNSHIYKGGGADPFYPTIPPALADVGSGDYVLNYEIPGNTDPPTVHQWVESDGGQQSVCDGLELIGTDRLEIQLSINHFPFDGLHSCDVIPNVSGFYNSFVSYFGTGNLVWWSGKRSGGADYFRGFHVAITDDDLADGASALTYFQGFTPDASGHAELFDATHYTLFDTEMYVQRSLQPRCDVALQGGWCITDGVLTPGYIEVSGTFHVLNKYEISTVSFDPTVVWNYPLGPCLRNDDPNYNNQAYWEAAYAAALADGAMLNATDPLPGDWVYGVDYPDTQDYAYFAECDQMDVACVPMATIVADLCRRAGLRTDTATQIDVSGLTTCVDGYIVARQMSARDAMGPLRLFGLWDAVESDALLKFVERGSAIVETLTADDLGTHENGSQAPTAVEVSRIQEKDLPRRVRLHFANLELDHEPSEQAASRLSTEAIDEHDVEIPISMSPDTAAQLAEITLYAQWVGRNSYRFSLDNSRLALEPTDCIEIPVDGQTERVRIVSVDYSIGGILRVEAIRDDDGSYVSTRVAAPSAPSGGTPGGPGSGLICPSNVVLLDIPRIRDIDIDAGYYAAIYGACDSWTCAELYRSVDGGLTYGRVARTDQETTVGQIISISGPPTDVTLPGDSPPYDTTSSITVTLFEGELSSITDVQIDAGQNLAAIGRDGRWVIIQFKTVTLDTTDQYTLTDLIWGVNDTEHLIGTTVDGDTFVLLSDPGLLRIPESATAIGVAKQFKVVTCGESVDAAAEITFTTWGLSYLRPCPSTVVSATQTDPPETATHGTSYLLPNDTSLSGPWTGHGGQIATWSDETDNWVYCIPAPGTIVHVGGDTSDPGDDVISGGDGTYTGAPWTPAIPPLFEESGIDPDASYFVVYTPDGYRKVLMSEADVGAGASAGVPYVDFSADTTLAVAHNGKKLVHPAGAGSGDALTIPDDTTGGFDDSQTTTVINLDSNDITIVEADTSVTLIWSQDGSTGTRTLTEAGMATLTWVAADTWLITGTGLS